MLILLCIACLLTGLRAFQLWRRTRVYLPLRESPEELRIDDETWEDIIDEMVRELEGSMRGAMVWAVLTIVLGIGTVAVVVL